MRPIFSLVFIVLLALSSETIACADHDHPAAGARSSTSSSSSSSRGPRVVTSRRGFRSSTPQSFSSSKKFFGSIGRPEAAVEDGWELRKRSPSRGVRRLRRSR